MYPTIAEINLKHRSIICPGKDIFPLDSRITALGQLKLSIHENSKNIIYAPKNLKASYIKNAGQKIALNTPKTPIQNPQA